jgi:hypothetical protein
MAERQKGKKRQEKAERPAGTSLGVGLGLRIKYLIISGKDEMKISKSAFGTVEDISLSGLVFQTTSMRIDDLHISYNDTPSIRNKLTLEIDLPNGRKITAMAEVSWYERSFATVDQDYHVGITFKEIGEEDREDLKEYLSSIDRAVETIALDVL